MHRFLAAERFKFRFARRLWSSILFAALPVLFCETSQATNSKRDDMQWGSPDEHPWVEFDGGDGPGACGIGMPGCEVDAGQLFGFPTQTFFTGLAFYNPDTESTDVTVKVYNSAGDLKGAETRPLPAGNRMSGLVN